MKSNQKYHRFYKLYMFYSPYSDFIFIEVYCGIIQKGVVFVNFNDINLRQSAPSYKPQVCEVMGFNSGAIVNLGIVFGMKCMFQTWDFKTIGL